MRLTLTVLTTLLALQAPSTPLVFDSRGATLRPVDIEVIARAVAPYGGRPWMLNVSRSMSRNGERRWGANAYLAPSSATSELRRGPLVAVTTEPTTRDVPDPDTWNVDDPARNLTWAQVALPGRPFDVVKTDADDNWPLAIRGEITDADLVSIVRFLRSRPSLPNPNGLNLQSVGPVRGILAPAVMHPRLPAVRVSLAGGVGCSWSVLLQRPAGDWVVESVEHGGCN